MIREGQRVTFLENDERPAVVGVVTRVWRSGCYVTIRTTGDHGRTFVRCTGRVAPDGGTPPMPREQHIAHLIAVEGFTRSEAELITDALLGATV